jgi:hypothetical protein
MGSVLAFVVEESTEAIQVVAFGPSDRPEENRLVSTGVKTDEFGFASRWLGLLIRQDLAAGKWDLFVDGKLVVANQALAPEQERSEWVIFGHASGPVWIDALTLSSENPLFADSDHDGLPDAYEVAHGLNRFHDDRAADRDGDGKNNLREFLEGTSPSAAGTSQPPEVFYVDNLSGNDTYPGRQPYTMAGDGPKASVKAAMAEISPGGVIILLKGRGTYEEGSRDAGGKLLTIRTVEPVTIR